MEETPKQQDSGKPTALRKACQIMIMFPVEDDADAMAIKANIDEIVLNLKDKKYNFSINEM